MIWITGDINGASLKETPAPVCPVCKKTIHFCVWVWLCLFYFPYIEVMGKKGINMSLLCVCFHIPFYKLTQFRVYSCRGHPYVAELKLLDLHMSKMSITTQSLGKFGKAKQSKQRQQPALVVTSVQVHQLALTSQRRRYRQQTSFLF